MIKEGKSEIISTTLLGAAIFLAGCGENSNRGGVGSQDTNSQTPIGMLYEKAGTIEEEIAIKQERNGKNVEILSKVADSMCKRQINNIYPRAWAELQGDLFFVYFEFKEREGLAFELEQPANQLTFDEARVLILKGIRSQNLNDGFKLYGFSLE